MDANLEETFGKIVGKVKHRSPGEAQDYLVKQFRAMGLKLPYPKGLYRFKTFEEANEWEWKHMMEAAKRKFRARRNPQT